MPEQLPTVPWYTSRAVWFALASGVLGIFPSLGVDAGATADALAGVGSLIAGLVAAYFRIVASHRLTTPEGLPGLTAETTPP